MQEHPVLHVHLLDLYVLPLRHLQLGADHRSAVLHGRPGSFVSGHAKPRLCGRGTAHFESKVPSEFSCCTSRAGFSQQPSPV